MTDHDLPLPTHWYQWVALGFLFVGMAGLEGCRRLVVRVQTGITDVARWLLR